jgi:hypothetical protein
MTSKRTKKDAKNAAHWICEIPLDLCDPLASAMVLR